MLLPFKLFFVQVLKESSLPVAVRLTRPEVELQPGSDGAQRPAPGCAAVTVPSSPDSETGYKKLVTALRHGLRGVRSVLPAAARAQTRAHCQPGIIPPNRSEGGAIAGESQWPEPATYRRGRGAVIIRP